MNERKKGAILSYIQVFLSVVVSMIYVPVLLHFLGQSEYGLYQIVGSFFSYVTVFESCVSAGILRNYCNALGRSDHEEAAVTLSMARNIYRFLALILDLVGIAVVFAFRSFYAGFIQYLGTERKRCHSDPAVRKYDLHLAGFGLSDCAYRA